jgi:glycosyltransferase involved in cell wall biosynthesis
MTDPRRSRPGIDLVIPLHDEAATLPALLANLAAQVDGEGRPLPRGSWRLVAVDNASADATREILENFARDPAAPETAVLAEPEKGVVQARMRGAGFALAGDGPRRFPVVVHADADNVFPPTFFYRMGRRLAAGDLDVLTWAGFRPAAFWRRVPEVARRHYREIGTIHFDAETIRAFGFDEGAALFSRRLWDDFRHVPHQCGLGMTKEAFARAGGYRREFHLDGRELLGEARNLLHRLARRGARMDYVADPPIALNPRRLLREPEALWAGRSYSEGMSDPRGEGTDEDYAALDRLAPRLEFRAMRRNLIQRFILDPCLAHPARLAPNRRYFGDAYEEVSRAVEEMEAQGLGRTYAEIRPLSEVLLDRCEREILAALDGLRA